MSRIYVDADACPVKSEAERVASRVGVSMFIVSNGGIRPSPNPLIETVVVSNASDAADDWIAERATRGDVVITADIPLAARCIDAGAFVVKPNGEELTPQNIGTVLAARNLMTDLRAADPFRQGGGKAFSQRDRSRFLDVLDRVLRRAVSFTD